MYDVDGNGTIDQDEMIKIVEAIYFMHSGNEDDKSLSKPDMDILAENVAKEIFSQIDVDGDGHLTKEVSKMKKLAECCCQIFGRMNLDFPSKSNSIIPTGTELD